MAVHVEYESMLRIAYVLFSCVEVYILPATIGVLCHLIS